MNINELKQLLQNNVNELCTRRNLAYNIGDIIEINRLDVEISETNSTLSKLSEV